MAKNPFIPYGRQWIEEDDIQSVVEVLKSDWLTSGPTIERFERELAAYCGAKYAVCCSNGTTALHLSQLALESSQKDHVVTSPNTFLASANCVRYVGGQVSFGDVSPANANIDPENIKKLVERNKDVKPITGVIPVHFGGHPAPMEEIHAIARENSMWIVEDGCHAIGASYRTSGGKRVKVGSCEHSDMTVFSFHPVKHIAMGEGGAVTTNSSRLYEKLISLRNHGMERSQDPETPWAYEMNSLGYNFRLTDMQAALGSSQLKKLDRSVERRREIAELYRRELPEIFGDDVRPLEESGEVYSSYHLFPIRIKYDKFSLTRGALMNDLKRKGIGTQVHYIPLHLQPYYQRCSSSSSGDLPNAESYYEEALSLPMYANLSVDQQRYVIDNLNEGLNKKS